MLLTVIAITYSSVCFAEEKSVIKDYIYQMGSGESRTDAEKNALIEVKLLAIEDVGTYLESDIEIVNSHLVKEEIWALTAGVMQTMVLETNSISEDKIYIKINAIVDTNDLKKKLNNRNFIDEAKRLQESNVILLQALKDLNAKLICAHNELDKKKIQTEIMKTQSQLRANDWFEEGDRALRTKNMI